MMTITPAADRFGTATVNIVVDKRFAKKRQMRWSKVGAHRLVRAFVPAMIGRTRGDQVVCFDGDLSMKGQLLDVEITEARNLTLFARPVAAPVVA